MQKSQMRCSVDLQYELRSFSKLDVKWFSFAAMSQILRELSLLVFYEPHALFTRLILSHLPELCSFNWQL